MILLNHQLSFSELFQSQIQQQGAGALLNVEDFSDFTRSSCVLSINRNFKMARVNILNVQFDNIYQRELLARLEYGGVVFTPNVDHLINLQKDREFFDIYQSADYRVCDSQILFYLSKFLGSPIKEKISGSDLFPAFYHYYRDKEEIKIFLLGAKEGVAQQAKERINAKVGRTMVVGAYSPPFGFEKDPAECRKIIEMVNQSGATVLAVGLGAPKQERFIFRYKNRFTNAKTFLAVGATIDFEAVHINRAPHWMSQLGLEWLHRLLSEPGRLWKRYLVDNPPVLALILLQKLGLYRNPFSGVYRRYPTRNLLYKKLDNDVETLVTTAD